MDVEAIGGFGQLIIGRSSSGSCGGYKFQDKNGRTCESCLGNTFKGVAIGEWVVCENGMEFLVAFYCRDCATMMGDVFFQVFGDSAYDLLS